MEKRCDKCGIVRSIYDFRKERRNAVNKISLDGYMSFCKICYKKSLLEPKPKIIREFKDSASLKYRRDYYRNKYEVDLNFKLKQKLRARFRKALKTNSKKSSILEHLGCTIEELKKYLEERFTVEMNWSNYGPLWEIDHIKPLCTFDLTKREELDIAWNFKNLRPLTKTENRRRNKRGTD